MDERRNGNPNADDLGFGEQVWFAAAPAVVIGGRRDAAGIRRLNAVLVLGPTATGLRSLEVRELEKYIASVDVWTPEMLAEDELEQRIWDREEPPTIAEVEEAWTSVLGAVAARQAAGTAALRAGILAGTPTPEPSWFPRRPGEPPEAFYQRVGMAYVWFRLSGSKTPAKDIEQLSGMKGGTVRKWIFEARRRGQLPDVESLVNEGEQR